MNENIEKLLKKINSSCELYGNTVSSFRWKVKRNYKHFLDIYNANGIDELRSNIMSYENPRGFFEFIKSLFFRKSHYKSMLSYFDLMKVILDFSSVAKNRQVDESYFVKTLLSRLYNFIGELDPSSKLHEELSVVKSELELLPSNIIKENEVLDAKLETVEDEVLEGPLEIISENIVLLDSAAIDLHVKMQEIKDGTDEVEKSTAAQLQATKKLQEETILLGNGIKQQVERSAACDAELSGRSEEIFRLKRMAQAKLAQRKKCSVSDGIHFFQQNGRLQTVENKSSSFTPR